MKDDPMPLSELDLKDATEAFWQACRRPGTRTAGQTPYPLHLESTLSQNEAYRINLDITARFEAEGHPRSGWKVGLTAKAIREQFGLPESLYACLFAEDRWTSGVTHSLADFTSPGWENELCLSMGEDLEGPGVTEEAARQAIASVAPALEIIEGRTPNTLDGVNCLIADNGQNRGYVVGEPTPFHPASTDLGASSVEVFIDGASVDMAPGSAVMESSPVASIVWLANKLSEFGIVLRAGEEVMTGSFTRQFAIDRPMQFESRFDPFGPVAATFAG